MLPSRSVHKYLTNTEAYKYSKVFGQRSPCVSPWGMEHLWHPYLHTLFLLCPICAIVLSSNKAMFKGCVAVQGKPARRGYLPVRKAALLGVQSGAAAMCWVSFTPSFARRSMFGVLKVQPMPPDVIQRVFQGNKKLYTYLYFQKFLLFEEDKLLFVIYFNFLKWWGSVSLFLSSLKISININFKIIFPTCTMKSLAEVIEL